MTKAWTPPGKPTRRSKTGRPIMALLDLAGRRWTLRVAWELRDAALTFRALQAACDGVSPTVLNDRLADLRAAHLVERAAGDGYALTALGRELVAHVVPLVAWSERWARATFYVA